MNILETMTRKTGRYADLGVFGGLTVNLGQALDSESITVAEAGEHTLQFYGSVSLMSGEFRIVLKRDGAIMGSSSYSGAGQHNVSVTVKSLESTTESLITIELQLVSGEATLSQGGVLRECVPSKAGGLDTSKFIYSRYKSDTEKVLWLSSLAHTLTNMVYEPYQKLTKITDVDKCPEELLDLRATLLGIHAKRGVMNNEQYRIFQKVLQIKNTSFPSIKALHEAVQVFDAEYTIKDNNNMTVDITLSDKSSEAARFVFMNYDSLPRHQGVCYNKTITSDKAFGYDDG